MSTQIEKYKPVEAEIAKVTENLKGKVYDIQKTAGLNEAKKDRRLVVGIRVKLEDMRKEMKAPVLKLGKDIDAEAKRLTELTAPLEDNLKQIVSAEEERKAKIKREREEKEKKRVAAIRVKMDDISKEPSLVFMLSSVKIAERIEALRAMDLSDGYDEFAEMAHQGRVAAVKKMEEMYEETKAKEEQDIADAKVREEEQAKIDAEKAELAKKQEAQRLIDEEHQRKEDELEAEKLKLAEQQEAVAKREAELEDAKKVEQPTAMRRDVEEAEGAMGQTRAVREYPAIENPGLFREKICKAIAEHWDPMPTTAELCDWITEFIQNKTN